jgi:hypothetical protein
MKHSIQDEDMDGVVGDTKVAAEEEEVHSVEDVDKLHLTLLQLKNQ